MADQSRSEIIKREPIGDGLNGFRDSFSSACSNLRISCSPKALDQLNNEGDAFCLIKVLCSADMREVLRGLAFGLISALLILPASRLLPSTRGKNLVSDLSGLISAVNSDDFDFDRIKPLLTAVVNSEPDEIVWDKVYDAVTETTPPPRSLPSIQQTPWLRNTSSFANSSEHRKYMDDVLKEELGSMYVGVPGFYETFFGDVGGLEPAAKAVFKRCREGDNPLYCEGSGWRGWPEGATEKDVLGWFAQLNGQLMDFAEQCQLVTKVRRSPTSRYKVQLRTVSWTSASWMIRQRAKTPNATGRKFSCLGS